MCEMEGRELTGRSTAPGRCNANLTPSKIFGEQHTQPSEVYHALAESTTTTVDAGGTIGAESLKVRTSNVMKYGQWRGCLRRKVCQVPRTPDNRKLDGSAPTFELKPTRTHEHPTHVWSIGLDCVYPFRAKPFKGISEQCLPHRGGALFSELVT